jgi:Helix-turn-helix domain of resolvase
MRICWPEPGRARCMELRRIAHLVAAGLLLSSPAVAQTLQAPTQLHNEGDLKLESAVAIKDFSIAYVTFGALNAKKSNAILMVTALGGNHHRLDFMIGPGKALDPEKYFIICTDAIRNGLTTSPSNSKLQPRMQATEQPIDTSSAAGKAFLDMLGVFAELPISARERQMKGIAAAQLRGVYKGRPPSIDAAKVAALKAEGLGATEIAKRLKVGRASVYRVLAS